MRLLVTGGAGFIGTHLCRRLLADGHAVSVVDNESTGRRENLPPGVRFIRGDVTRLAEVEPAFAGGLDAVCHIAGQVSIIRSFSDPTADLRTNVEGTLNVLQLCLKYKVPRLIYASSMTLYGDCKTVPTPESEALPARFLLRHHQVRRRALRALHRAAPRPRFRFRRHVAAHVQRLWSGPVLQQPLSGRARHLLRQPAARRAHHHLRRRRADPRLRLHRRHRGGLGARARDARHPAGRSSISAAGARSRSTSSPRPSSPRSGSRPAGHRIVRAAARPGEQRSVAPTSASPNRMLGWEPRTPFEAGLADDRALGPGGICRCRRRQLGRPPAMKTAARDIGRPMGAQRRDRPQVRRGRPRPRA